MFNVCPHCGHYEVEKEIDPAGPFAICPTCNQRIPFVQAPLFVLSGASGVGKSTVCYELAGTMPDVIFMEVDILWQPAFNTPDDDYRGFRESWLRLAKNISQNGPKVVLCGSAVPAQYERSPERRYFSQIHYLALTCDSATLTARLQARPSWRQSSGLGFIDQMCAFNQWFLDNATQTDPPITLLDTAGLTVAESTDFIRTWIRSCL
jgi:predicted kinase